MNLLQLVLKQMRQRALGTVLTIISVMLGVALACGIVLIRKGAGDLLGQKSFGTDIVIGTKGSPLQLVVNSIYHISTSPGNISYSLFERIDRDPTYRALVRTAVPIQVGDSYKNLPIVGTLPRILGFDDVTLEPKTGYDAMGRPLDGFLPPDASDEDVETSGGKQRRSGVFEVRPGQKLILAQGRPFHRDRFECVIGSDVTKLTGLKLGDTFQATHGFPRPDQKPDIHKPKWTVVGVLEPTRSANDRCLFIGLTSAYTLAEHEEGMVSQQAIRDGTDPKAAWEAFKKQKQAELEAARAAQADHSHDHDHDHDHGSASHPAHDDDDPDNYTLSPTGDIQLLLPKEDWALSAILVKARSQGAGVQALKYIINNGRDATAANPAEVMREFFDNFIDNYTLVLVIVSALVSIVAGVGILVSIYNSVAARLREIAILRALGATRARILTLICTEAGLIGLIGGALGVLLGHAAAGIGSAILYSLLGQGIPFTTVSNEELLYLLGVVILSVLAGLVPALKAYKVPVATNLSA
jgi:putative ABC transport system permease protein